MQSSASFIAPLARLATLEGFLFDGDGVLFDSEELTLIAFCRTMADYGVEIDRHGCNRWVGVCTKAILKEIESERGVHIDHDEFTRRRNDLYYALCRSEQGPKPRPGIPALLDELDRLGLPYAIGSNAPREKVYFNLEQSGIAPRISARVCVDEVRQGKPAPDIFLRCAELLGRDPRRCAVVEDSVSGLLAAKAAGSLAIAFEGSLPLEELAGVADIVYPGAEELLADMIALTATSRP
jgi:HAD superfamily hydrolase (TIGR01509 family)